MAGLGETSMAAPSRDVSKRAAAEVASALGPTAAAQAKRAAAEVAAALATAGKAAPHEAANGTGDEADVHARMAERCRKQADELKATTGKAKGAGKKRASMPLRTGDEVAVKAYWFDGPGELRVRDRWSYQTFGAKWYTAECVGVVRARDKNPPRGGDKKETWWSIEFDSMDGTGATETHSFKRRDIRLVKAVPRVVVPPPAKDPKAKAVPRVVEPSSAKEPKTDKGEVGEGLSKPRGRPRKSMSRQVAGSTKQAHGGARSSANGDGAAGGSARDGADAGCASIRGDAKRRRGVAKGSEAAPPGAAPPGAGGSRGWFLDARAPPVPVASVNLAAVPEVERVCLRDVDFRQRALNCMANGGGCEHCGRMLSERWKSRHGVAHQLCSECGLYKHRHGGSLDARALHANLPRAPATSDREHEGAPAEQVPHGCGVWSPQQEQQRWQHGHDLDIDHVEGPGEAELAALCKVDDDGDDRDDVRAEQQLYRQRLLQCTREVPRSFETLRRRAHEELYLRLRQKGHAKIARSLASRGPSTAAGAVRPSPSPATPLESPCVNVSTGAGDDCKSTDADPTPVGSAQLVVPDSNEREAPPTTSLPTRDDARISGSPADRSPPQLKQEEVSPSRRLLQQAVALSHRARANVIELAKGVSTMAKEVGGGGEVGTAAKSGVAVATIEKMETDRKDPRSNFLAPARRADAALKDLKGKVTKNKTSGGLEGLKMRKSGPSLSPSLRPTSSSGAGGARKVSTKGKPLDVPVGAYAHVLAPPVRGMSNGKRAFSAAMRLVAKLGSPEVK